MTKTHLEINNLPIHHNWKIFQTACQHTLTQSHKHGPNQASYAAFCNTNNAKQSRNLHTEVQYIQYNSTLKIRFLISFSYTACLINDFHFQDKLLHRRWEAPLILALICMYYECRCVALEPWAALHSTAGLSSSSNLAKLPLQPSTRTPAQRHQSGKICQQFICAHLHTSTRARAAAGAEC